MENNGIINKLNQAVKRINDLETELENIKQKNSWNFASIGKKSEAFVWVILSTRKPARSSAEPRRVREYRRRSPTKRE